MVYVGPLQPFTTTDEHPFVLRPGWLADDDHWRDQLAALTQEEQAFLASEWALAGGPPPAIDLSWIRTEKGAW